MSEEKHDRLINLINSNVKDDANYLINIINEEIKKVFFKGDIHTSMKLFDMYVNH